MAQKRERAQERWAKELAHARETAGLTGRQLAEAINVAPSTVGMWETGKRTPHPDDLKRCEERLNTNGYLARLLTEWVSREISPEWLEWREVEGDATEILTYETRLIPGILQLPRYMETILPADKVEQRLERQKILEPGNPPQFEALIDESVLYRKVGSPEIMAAQLNRLVELSSQDLIVRVVPFSANIVRFTLSFVLATVDSGKQVAYLDSALKGRIVERADEIAELRRFWSQTGAEALSQQNSIDLIQKTINERWPIS